MLFKNKYFRYTGMIVTQPNIELRNKRWEFVKEEDHYKALTFELMEEIQLDREIQQYFSNLDFTKPTIELVTQTMHAFPDKLKKFWGLEVYWNTLKEIIEDKAKIDRIRPKQLEDAIPLAKNPFTTLKKNGLSFTFFNEDLLTYDHFTWKVQLEGTYEMRGDIEPFSLIHSYLERGTDNTNYLDTTDNSDIIDSYIKEAYSIAMQIDNKTDEQDKEFFGRWDHWRHYDEINATNVPQFIQDCDANHSSRELLTNHKNTINELLNTNPGRPILTTNFKKLTKTVSNWIAKVHKGEVLYSEGLKPLAVDALEGYQLYRALYALIKAIKADKLVEFESVVDSIEEFMKGSKFTSFYTYSTLIKPLKEHFNERMQQTKYVSPEDSDSNTLDPAQQYLVDSGEEIEETYEATEYYKSETYTALLWVQKELQTLQLRYNMLRMQTNGFFSKDTNIDEVNTLMAFVKPSTLK